MNCRVGTESRLGVPEMLCEIARSEIENSPLNSSQIETIADDNDQLTSPTPRINTGLKRRLSANSLMQELVDARRHTTHIRVKEEEEVHKQRDMQLELERQKLKIYEEDGARQHDLKV